MISLQKHRFARSTTFDQQIECLARVWATIDVITQVDFYRTINGASRKISVYYGEHVAEQIDAAMDVAKSVDADPIW